MLKFHRHKWVYDSQGAEYCQGCRKFRRWLPGKVTVAYMCGGKGVSGWGYLLNGKEWQEEMDRKILAAGGYYL